MTQELIKTKGDYLQPQNFEQAERYATMISKSSLCPDAFRNKPGDVLIAMAMGAEVGLSPMQALQNIAVIKGRPCIWGDAMVALVRVHKHCKAIRQWMTGSFADKNAESFCGITRKGQPEEIRSFSYAQALKAGLLAKPGSWTDYPERMLQWRATGWCCRDVFPDALRGLHIAEEVEDYIDITPPTNTVTLDERPLELKQTPISQQEPLDEAELQKHLDNINNALSRETLVIAFNDAQRFAKVNKEALNQVCQAKDIRKLFFEAKKPSATIEEKEEWLKDYDKEEK
jgi:hypothetical protein